MIDKINSGIYSYMMEAITQSNDNIQYCSKNLLSNKSFVAEALNANPGAYKFLPVYLRNDPELFEIVLDKRPDMFMHATDDVRADKNIAIKVIKKNIMLADYVDESLLHDEDIANLLIKLDQKMIKKVHQAYKTDKNFVLKQISLYGNKVFPYIDPLLKGDKNFILRCMRHNVEIFENIPVHFYTDMDIVNLAIQKNSYYMGFMSDELRDNKDFVFKAVSINGKCIASISDRLKNDIDVCIEALKVEHDVLYLLGDSVLRLFPDILQISRKNYNEIDTIISHKKAELIKEANNCGNIQIIKDLVNIDGLVLGMLPESYRVNYEIVYMALKQNRYAIKYVGDLIKRDLNNLTYEKQLLKLKKYMK